MSQHCEVKTVSVIGLGYIGLPTATMFASRGFSVIGVEVNPQVVNTINQGQIHIVEPGLTEVVQAAVTSGRLRATTRPEPADAFLLAVPTPFTQNHEPDLSYIEAATRSIAPVIKKGDMVILESTSPVGTTEQLADWLAEARPDLTFPQQVGEESDIRIAHCPERVLPGHILRELVENDRIVGGMTPKCAQAAAALYKAFIIGDCITTNARTAEMCKLSENSFRDVNIAFANELSMICDKLDIDVWELIRLANRHPRVNILQPGCGVGGHCIAVDPWFIFHKTPEEAKLIHMARLINDFKPQWVISRVESCVTELISEGIAPEDVQIACLGLAFKPDIADLRESPALEITRSLGGKYPNRVYAVEPNIKELPDELTGLGVALVSLEDALSTARVVVLLVDHAEFKTATVALGSIVTSRM